MSTPFVSRDGIPQLTDSVVLYLDILGSTDMANDERAQEYLERMSMALSAAKRGILERRGDDPYKVVSFTDNVVLGWPLKEDESPEAELGSTLFLAAFHQYELVLHGLFVRGGLTRGLLFMDDDFVFGPGLIEAYELEHNVAIQPRIVLSRRAESLSWQHTEYYAGGVPSSPQNATLLYSSDGQMFLSYLAFLDEPDDDTQEILGRHKEAVEQALRDFSTKPYVWEKYRWVADYHNYFCSGILSDRHELLIKPEATSTRFITMAEFRENPKSSD